MPTENTPFSLVIGIFSFSLTHSHSLFRWFLFLALLWMQNVIKLAVNYKSNASGEYSRALRLRCAEKNRNLIFMLNYEWQTNISKNGKLTCFLRPHMYKMVCALCSRQEAKLVRHLSHWNKQIKFSTLDVLVPAEWMHWIWLSFTTSLAFICCFPLL